MSNMSYCRFRNTRGDLAACRDALEQLMSCDVSENESVSLGEDELDAAKELVALCAEVVLRVVEDGPASARDGVHLLHEMSRRGGAARAQMEAQLDQANADAQAEEERIDQDR